MGMQAHPITTRIQNHLTQRIILTTINGILLMANGENLIHWDYKLATDHEVIFVVCQ